MEKAKKTKNPLTSFMRRPKLFLRLPSQGKWWPDDAVDLGETGELEVYPMSVKDELFIKTPDALMNGSATANVLQSCIPAIKDVWSAPSIDMDAMLVAIRIATYGEKLTMDVEIPTFNETEPFEIDLRPVLDSMIDEVYWDEVVKVNDDITVIVKPIDYRTMSRNQLITFEAERLFRVAANPNITEEDKSDLVNKGLEKLADATLNQILNGIVRIDTSQGSTDDYDHIKEFLANSDPEVFKAVSARFKDLNERNKRSTIELQTPPQYAERGAPATITSKFEFDYASFFG